MLSIPILTKFSTMGALFALKFAIAVGLMICFIIIATGPNVKDDILKINSNYRHFMGTIAIFFAIASMTMGILPMFATLFIAIGVYYRHKDDDSPKEAGEHKYIKWACVTAMILSIVGIIVHPVVLIVVTKKNS